MLNERKLTENELEQRQIVLKGLLKNKHALVSKYGKDAEKVMYGIATKKAKKRVEDMNKEKLKELIHKALQREQGPATNVEPYHDQTSTIDTGFSGRADYGEEDKALGREDELEMKGFEENIKELAGYTRRGTKELESEPSKFKGRDKSKLRGLKEGTELWEDDNFTFKRFAGPGGIALQITVPKIKGGGFEYIQITGDKVKEFARAAVHVAQEFYDLDHQVPINELIIREFVGDKLEKRVDKYWGELVPGEGNAATIEGEILRAINKIVYRYYNDGDYFYTGYGAETAGPAVSFLMHSDEIPINLQQTLTSIFNKAIGAPEAGYERLLKFALEKVLDHLDSKDGDYTKSNEDMLSYESEFEDEGDDYEEEDDYYDDEYEDEDYMNENSKQIKEKLNINPEVSRLVNAFIRKMADRYDYSLQDAVYNIVKVMKDHNYKGVTTPSKLPTGIDRVQEKLTKKSSLKKHIEDFKDSDAPQFKGKSADKKRKMAVAAFLSKRND